MLGSEDVCWITRMRVGSRARDHTAYLVVGVDGMPHLHRLGTRHKLVVQLLRNRINALSCVSGMVFPSFVVRVLTS